MVSLFSFYTLLLILLPGLAYRPRTSSTSQNFTNTKRLIKLKSEEKPKWTELKDINKLILRGHNKQQGYFDMTGLNPPRRFNYPGTKIPTSIRFKNVVKELISKIQENSMKSFIFNFTTNFSNRLASSPQGKLAEKWLLNQIQIISNSSSSTLRIRVQEWIPPPRNDGKSTWHYNQSSILVRIHGSDPRRNIRKEVIILGANIDSINRHHHHKNRHTLCPDLFNCPEMIAPGANDNASGCSVLLEVFRILVEDEFVPRRTLEFHFYAASKYGSSGALAVASWYREKNINVVGMLCLSQVGYSLPPAVYEPFHPSMKESLQVALHPKGTDSNLNRFLKLLVDQHLEVDWVEKTFCMECHADYVAWVEYNFPASFVYGWEYSPDNHRQSDVYETINFKYLMEFAKLAAAFFVEFGEPLRRKNEIKK